jgi:hypothetical protein
MLEQISRLVLATCHLNLAIKCTYKLVQQHEKVAYKADVETPTNTAINHLPTTHFYVDALLAPFVTIRMLNSNLPPGTKLA